jgi:hypothetical protein
MSENAARKQAIDHTASGSTRSNNCVCLVQNTAGKTIPGAAAKSAVPQQIPQTSPVVKPIHSPSKPVIISVDPPKAITMADWHALMSKEVAALCTAVDKLPEEFQGSTKKLARYAGLASAALNIHIILSRRQLLANICSYGA